MPIENMANFGIPLPWAIFFQVANVTEVGELCDYYRGTDSTDF